MAESKSKQQNIEHEQLTVDTELEVTADETIRETPEMCPTFGFKEKSWMTDFILVVEGTKFYVAKNILALASPVFEKMFESDFKEKTSDELELTGKRAEDVNEFLLAVYPSAATVSNLSKEKALKVLPLAEEYQVLNLKQKCEDALLGSIDDMTSAEELFRLIKDSHLYSVSSLYKRCIQFLSKKSMDELDKANKNILLPAEPLRDIIQNLTSRMKEVTEELETNKTWKKYISKAMKKSEIPKLNEELYVVGKSSMVTINIVKMKPVEDLNITFLNTKLKLHFEITWVITEGNIIFARLETNDENDYNIFIQFVVVNRMPLEEHLPVKHEVAVRSCKPSSRCRIVALNQIEDPKKGFVVDEKIQIEVNVFMSNPKKK